MKGRAVPQKHVRDLYVDTYKSQNTGHKWTKHQGLIGHHIGVFSGSGIVLDPFTGGGTVPAVCKMLGRKYLAFEIDSTTCDLARERVRMTQPPLFVPEPVQEAMVL